MALVVSRTPQRGIELGYAEITADFPTSSTHTTFQDVTGLTVTVTVGARPIIVRFGCSFAAHSTTGGIGVQIVETATMVAICAARIGTANYTVPLSCQARLAPSAGSHTYKVQFHASVVNAAATLYADVASGASPAWIQVLEV